MGIGLLIVGLVVFLGAHSVKVFADDWRTAQLARLGEGGWKAAVGIASLAGFVALIYGYGLARVDPVILWSPPVAARHLNALLTLVAFVFLAAAYVPGNQIKGWVGHPMIIAVKIWAFGHLLANGSLGAVILFGSFLAWAIVDFAASRRRDRRLGTHYPRGGLPGTALAVIVGMVGWALFVARLHLWLIGVSPMG